MTKKIKTIIKNNSIIFQNFSYITLLELFLIVSPLITYPYLLRILGTELYGFIITARIIASYAVILVDFGFKSITAKDISIHRNNKNKLSEIISSILFIRTILWILSFIFYYIIISLVPAYNEYKLLFIFSFGITFNELLFPQFYFQGIEKMKYITFIRIGISSCFILLTFLFIKNKEDFYLVPLFRTIGLFIGGIISLYIIFIKHNLKFKKPKISILKGYILEASPVFLTRIITSFKDKFSYILLGSLVGMHEVSIYDLGMKLNGLLVLPISILSQVLLPKIARERNYKLYKKILGGSMLFMLIIIIVYNLFLPFITSIFISEKIHLLPLRIFSLAALFFAASSFMSTNGLIAFGYTKQLLYSIIITTAAYIIATGSFYFANMLNNVLIFIIITVFAFFVEFIYRLFISKKIIKNEKISLM